MSVNRRVFLGTAVATIVALRAEADPLKPVPATSSPDDAVVIEAKPGMIRLLSKPAGETPVWTYNQSVPGPLLRVKKGAEVKVRLVNKLDQPTTLRWHGVRLPNPMDGVGGLTQKPVAPGESFDYRFTPPDSGVFWYHPHAWPYSAEQVDRGLYGVLIVDEVQPPVVDEDLLVVIDDWSLDEHGKMRAFAEADAKGAGRIGSLLTVNAKATPEHLTFKPASRLRLRLVSAVDARIMIVAFEGASPKVQAIDGQPCEIFEPVRHTIPIGPGARFDVMLDLPSEADKEVKLVLRGDGVADQTLMAIKTVGAARAAHPAMSALPPNDALPTKIPLERALKLNLVIEGGASVSVAAPQPSSREPKPEALPKPVDVKPEAPKPDGDPRHLWTINGVASDGFSSKPLFKVKRGSAVSLTLINKTGFAQQIHVHGHVMRLLHDLDDGWEPYWRDAVLIGPERTKHVAFVADNPGKWSLESLVLDRQVSGLAAWFEVT